MMKKLKKPVKELKKMVKAYAGETNNGCNIVSGCS